MKIIEFYITFFICFVPALVTGQFSHIKTSIKPRTLFRGIRGITSCEVAGLAKGGSDGDTYSLDLALVRHEFQWQYFLFFSCSTMNINRVIQARVDVEFLLDSSTRQLTSERSGRVEHKKRNFRFFRMLVSLSFKDSLNVCFCDFLQIIDGISACRGSVKMLLQI